MFRNVYSMVDETWTQTPRTNSYTKTIWSKDEREWTQLWRLQNWKKITKHFKVGMYYLWWLSNLWWLYEQNKKKTRIRNKIRFDGLLNDCRFLCVLFAFWSRWKWTQSKINVKSFEVWSRNQRNHSKRITFNTFVHQVNSIWGSMFLFFSTSQRAKEVGWMYRNSKRIFRLQVELYENIFWKCFDHIEQSSENGCNSHQTKSLG